MRIETARIRLLLYEIKENAYDLEKALAEYTDTEIISNKAIIKSIKYTLVELSEAMSLVLQHILAKKYGQPVKGYIDTIRKASELKIISDNLAQKLKPFFDFRNSLIHRYWMVNNEILIENCRNGHKDFYGFIDEIENFLGKENV